MNSVCTVLIGSYAPQGDSVIVGGINPQTLHQTTRAISAEYLIGYAVMDDDFSVALSGSLSDWLQALPEYQRRTVTQMLEGGDPIAVSLAWLSSTGPTNTEPFGAIRNAPNVFYDNLLSQLQSLLCKRNMKKNVVKL